MRGFIALLAFICVVSGCGNRNSPANLRAHGIVSIHDHAPFCMVYVGLRPNESGSFYRAFWHFADENDIRTSGKHYTAYSGPPRATGMNDSVAFYVDYRPTTNVLARHKTFDAAGLEEPHSWEFASVEFNAYMPTNACLVTQDGQEIPASFTGSIGMVSYDTNFPVADFKKLSEELIATMQAAFPDRKVRFVSYFGNESKKIDP